LAGPKAWAILRQLGEFRESLPAAAARGRWTGGLRLHGLNELLPAETLTFAAPASYTGNDLVELHVPGSPPLVESLMGQLVRAGARLAEPGEFTLRAFLAGKLDLTQAEAVLGVIEAKDEAVLHGSLSQLAGNLAHPLHEVRDDLLNLLADVEAGLDFSDEDLVFLSSEQIANRITHHVTKLTESLRQTEARGVASKPLRVVLTGPANAGKSSLFNALTGTPGALVSPEPGTTRDYLSARVKWDGLNVELIDTAGEASATETIGEQAQVQRVGQGAAADLLLRCVPVDEPGPVRLMDGREVEVRTKADLAPAVSGLATSSLSGQGLAELRAVIVERARAASRHGKAELRLARCHAHVAQALVHLRQAEEIVSKREPADLLALDLRLALEQLGELLGSVYTNDLLDRVFSRFCIGK
jgi:tRNA modification GTPase